MARTTSDRAKARQWGQRLRRFSRSGQTVAAFCAAEGVSVPAFYQWRRKLAGGTGKQTGRNRPRRHAEPAGNGQPPAFQLLRLTGGDRPAGVVIRLPGGVTIELDHDPVTVQKVVAQLLDHQAPREHGR